MLPEKKYNSVLFDGRFLGDPRYGIARDSIACFKALNETEAIGGVLSYKLMPFLPDGFSNCKIYNLKNTHSQLVLKNILFRVKLPQKDLKTNIFFQSQVDSLKFEFENPYHRLLRIHDLFPITHPEWFNKSTVYLFNKGLKNIQEGTTIFVNSKYTLKIFQELVDWERKKLQLFVVPCDATRPISKKCNVCTACNSVKLDDKKYLLSVGTIEPRKNYLKLIRAWKKNKENSIYQHLVIVGKVGWRSKEIMQMIQSENSVIHFNDCCDAGLDELYKNATAFITASFHEGYNIPLDEAASFGCKLLISDAAVHRERFDPSEGLWFDPNNIQDIANAICQDTQSISNGNKPSIKFPEAFLSAFQIMINHIE
jgi:glycosyltransferase involved in cell wall biosynthesis